jgi:hypothetical protein
MTAGEIATNEKMTIKAFVNIIHRDKNILTFIQDRIKYQVGYEESFNNEIMEQCKLYQILEMQFTALAMKNNTVRGTLNNIAGCQDNLSGQVEFEI